MSKVDAYKIGESEFHVAYLIRKDVLEIDVKLLA